MKKADKIYCNGTILTMDDNLPVAESVAVKDGKIIFVGSNEDVDKYKSENCDTFNLKGKTMMPGFIDSHTHAPGKGYIKLFRMDLQGAKKEEELLQRIKDYILQNPDKEICYGSGFNAGLFKGIESKKGPKKEKLDNICSDKPVLLTDESCHTLWLNSAALKKFNITKNTTSPIGGKIEIDEETEELWGTLKEEALSLVPSQKFSLEQKVEALKLYQNKFNSLGYTTVLALREPESMSNRETIFDAFKKLEEENKLTLRVNGALDIDSSKDLKTQIKRLKELREKFNSKLIRASTAKFFADGVVEGMTACLLEPYCTNEKDEEPYYGEFLWKVHRMKEAFKEAVKEGFMIHVHCIGDGASKYTLDAFEEAYESIPGEKYRNTITHLQLIREEDIDRMAKLNITACTQPYWHFKEPGIFENIEKPLLGERAEKMYPLKTFLDKGILVTASSDHPVTEEPNPFYAVQAAVTRNLYNAENYSLEPIKNTDDPLYLLNKEERVDVMDLMKAYTINGAYALKREDEVGSIEVGKYADFVILSSNPLEVETLNIEKIKILETIFEGETVYRRKDNF